MPYGKGTYGKKRGRPPKKRKKGRGKVTRIRRGKKPGTKRRTRGQKVY